MYSGSIVSVVGSTTIVDTTQGIFHLDRGPMTGPEFLALLDDLGLSRSEAARLAGVNRSSVTRWTQNGIPYAYLLAILVSL